MGIFTTREIAFFIYVVILIIYLLLHKKFKSIVMPVIKAALHIKLVIPFLIVLTFAALFVYVCTYLPFWDWIYIKDIVLWVFFAGVPICFNATSRNLENNYFKNILIDNLKFTALTEFITGTFTFHIIAELILQPVLFIFVILQATAKQKTDSVKKIIDGLIGITGIIIIFLTIKSAIDSFDDIQYIDILVGLLLPIVLSVFYLPMAYFFAVYAKYDVLFFRMSFRENKNKKQKIIHRCKVICACKLSYKKICKFLNEYSQKMYVNMNENDFDVMINDFRKSQKTFID